MSSLLTDLEIYYEFEGNANDSSGNGNNATTANVLFDLANGKILQGGRFRNSPKSTWIKTTTTLPASGAYPFSVSFWIKVASLGSFPYVFSISSTTDSAGVPNPGTGFIGAFLNNTGALFLIGLTFGSIGFVNDGLFHHIAITCTGTTLISYFDGNFVSSYAVTQNLSDNTVQIASIVNNPPYNSFSGSIDEFGVWSRVLTAGEVTALYNAGAGLAYPFSTGAPSNASFLFQLL